MPPKRSNHPSVVGEWFFPWLFLGLSIPQFTRRLEFIPMGLFLVVLPKTRIFPKGVSGAGWFEVPGIWWNTVERLTWTMLGKPATDGCKFRPVQVSKKWNYECFLTWIKNYSSSSALSLSYNHFISSKNFSARCNGRGKRILPAAQFIDVRNRWVISFDKCRD